MTAVTSQEIIDHQGMKRHFRRAFNLFYSDDDQEIEQTLDLAILEALLEHRKKPQYTLYKIFHFKALRLLYKYVWKLKHVVNAPRRDNGKNIKLKNVIMENEKGEEYIPELAPDVFETVEAIEIFENLSAKQQEALFRLTKGETQPEIAKAMGYSNLNHVMEALRKAYDIQHKPKKPDNLKYRCVERFDISHKEYARIVNGLNLPRVKGQPYAPEQEKLIIEAIQNRVASNQDHVLHARDCMKKP